MIKRKSKDPEKRKGSQKEKAKDMKRVLSHDTHVPTQLIMHDGPQIDQPFTLGLTI